ncbi:hypothetical protein KUL118_51180 [Tenacibaculum sp. KUL118]|uniref:Uncharacterized protein n=1 Tax=Tenacibaculum sp. Pbs-1 TaxID=3238748 RepID=A0AB33KWH8_9FLAO|nr:hypothetical protein BACT7_14500 [Tenacibaculum mesophilum]BFF39904.1 hypothetical protein BACY1_17090 [Tenacibaculum mesophilum]GFD82256.1 hypothetical protein KUL118_51180 [Tenacibaculum sp. KUL118]
MSINPTQTNSYFNKLIKTGATRTIVSNKTKTIAFFILNDFFAFTMLFNTIKETIAINGAKRNFKKYTIIMFITFSFLI